MKINMAQTLLTPDGKYIMREAGKPLIMLDVCRAALLQGDQTESGDRKMHRWELAMTLKPEGCDVKTEDVLLLKESIGKMYLPLVVGPVFYLLEGKDMPDGYKSTEDLPRPPAAAVHVNEKAKP